MSPLTGDATMGMKWEIGADPDTEQDQVPPRFMLGIPEPLEARRRWQATKLWRREEEVDSILDQPQENYAVCKKYYPHYLHKHSYSNQLVYIERPGKCNYEEFWKSGLTLDHLARHYVFCSEICWRIVDPRDNGRLVSIFDVDGGTMNDLAGNTLKLFKKCTEVIQLHYPERSEKMFIINAPWWFQAAWSIVSPFIDARTRKKISVLGKVYQKELLKDISPENLPIEFGGTDTCPLGMSPSERIIWNHVTKVNAQQGAVTESMESVYEWQQKHLHTLQNEKIVVQGATPMSEGPADDSANYQIND
eukprot:Lankesteria_metandrocarpae@DN736_c0_g1_i1.p1